MLPFKRIPYLIWLLILVAVALLAFAACGEGEERPATPTATASPTGTPAAATATIKMVPTISFDTDELQVAAGTVTFTADNTDTGVSHNFAVYTDEAFTDLVGQTKICTAPCTETVTLTLEPGDYFFRCEVHPKQMTGKIKVEQGVSRGY